MRTTFLSSCPLYPRPPPHGVDAGRARARRGYPPIFDHFPSFNDICVR
jgi:hypothetical protein